MLAEREICGREREMARGNIVAVDGGVGVERNGASSSEPAHTCQAHLGGGCTCRRPWI